MPRVRAAKATGSSGLPIELADPQNALWTSSSRVTEWLVSHGVKGFDVGAHGPLRRHQLAVDGWADAHDWVRVSDAGHRNPDWARLYAAGVPHASRAVYRERMQARDRRLE